MAVLQFQPDSVGQIDGEMWDEAGMGGRKEDGSYVLRIPYWETRDLLPEILRLGTQVRVIAPEQLRCAVSRHFREALEAYEDC